MDSLLLPAVQDYRRLSGPAGPLPGRVTLADLPERLCDTLPHQALSGWRQDRPGSLAVRLQQASAAGYAPRDLQPFQRRESYRLTLEGGSAVIEHEDMLGAFRGLTTLAQILRLSADLGRRDLEAAAIVDYPCLEYRGLMYDFARSQIHREGHFESLLALCVEHKLTHFDLYFEERFGYPSLPEFAGNPHFLSAEQAKRWDAWANKNFLTLIPQTNCLGHNEGFLSRERYRPLAEDGFRSAQLCPSRPETLAHLEQRFRDFAGAFSSPIFHVGGDEAWELGYCPACREAVRRHQEAEKDGDGKGELYRRHVEAVHGMVTALGRRPALWGDMAKNHPAILPRLPKDTIIYDWIYGGSNEASLRAFRDAGYAVVACAAERGCFYLTYDPRPAMNNVEKLFGDAIRLRLYGGEITCWEMERGNSFHPSLHGVLYAAHFLWSGRPLERADLDRRVGADWLGVEDPAFGRVVERLGAAVQDRLVEAVGGAWAERKGSPYNYHAFNNLPGVRAGIFGSTTEVPGKQSPFYHLLGWMTSPAYQPAALPALRADLQAARADLAELAAKARRHANQLRPYELAWGIYELTLHMLGRIAALEGDYRGAAEAQARGERDWPRGLRGLIEFLEEIEARYRALWTLRQEDCREFGHPEEDLRGLENRIAAAREFRAKIERLEADPSPLPAYYRLLLEYPIRPW